MIRSLHMVVQCCSDSNLLSSIVYWYIPMQLFRPYHSLNNVPRYPENFCQSYVMYVNKWWRPIPPLAAALSNTHLTSQAHCYISCTCCLLFLYETGWPSLGMILGTHRYAQYALCAGAGGWTGPPTSSLISLRTSEHRLIASWPPVYMTWLHNESP